MKANETPEKLYVNFHFIETHPWSYQPLVTEQGVNKYDIEYTRTDAFIEKATQFLYDYNQKQVLKHGARATLGCGEYIINVDDFRTYMKGE